MIDAKDDDDPLHCDAENEGTNYRGLALQIGDDLHDDDIEALKFISLDFVSAAKLERTKTIENLLETWEKSKRFGKNNPWFLAECLYRIHRLDLLEDLGIEEEQVQQRHSQISGYRRMLLEVAEDLDSNELHKMLFLLGDLKKKDKGKILNPMGMLTYLEQTKQITTVNLHKLKEMLENIDRNDLIDVIIDYEVSKGLVSSPTGTDKEERMDTAEGDVQIPQTHSNVSYGKSSRRTVAEHPPSLVGETRLGVAMEKVTAGLKVQEPSAGAGLVSPAVVQPPHSGPQVEAVKQDVIVEPLLLDISHRVAQEVDDKTWIVFGYQLRLSPETLQWLSRRYPQMHERVYNLLTVWLHSWKGGHDAAMAAIIGALHEVQIHHLAEQFSKMYRPQGTSELHGISLSSHTNISNEHANISVNTTEARYQEPQEIPTDQKNVVPPSEPIDTIMPVYRMDNKPRGICIIISNEKFYKDPEDAGAREMPNREGTKVDAENLLKTFTDLHFEVHLHENYKSTDMVRLLVNVSLNVDHSLFDCFVCCILSHGTQGYIYGTDGRLVNITDLTGPFKSVVCPTLAGKPKLFFIQACQGREKQPGQEIEKDSAEVETDGMPREVIPNESDFLIGYATVPGFVSYRSRSHGSWYITKLCEMLNKYGTKYDLLSVLLLVNNEVGRANAMMDGGRYKQSPAPLYTLRKKLMFK